MLVTHALDTVVDVCDRAVMLDHGRLHMDGEPAEVVRELRHRLLSRDPSFVAEEGSRQVEIVSVSFDSGGDGNGTVWPGAELTITVDVRSNEPVADLDASFAVVSAATNHAVVDGRTSAHGRGHRGRSTARSASDSGCRPPSGPAASTSSRSASNRSTATSYHIQTQRYLLQVPGRSAHRHAARCHSPACQVEDL